MNKFLLGSSSPLLFLWVAGVADLGCFAVVVFATVAWMVLEVVCTKWARWDAGVACFAPLVPCIPGTSSAACALIALCTQTSGGDRESKCREREKHLGWESLVVP